MSEFFPTHPELYEWQRINRMQIDLANGPITLALADHLVSIVDAPKALERRWPYLIIDDTFDAAKLSSGFIGLHERTPVLLGRAHTHSHFEFSPQVSRNHVALQRYGTLLDIEDLGSRHGTYLIKQPAGYSEASELHPDHNEDAFFIDEAALALGVLDGMGGLEGSERAAHLAANVIAAKVHTLPRELPRGQADRAMRWVMNAAHEAVMWERLRTGQVIGTTATVAQLFTPQNESPYLAVPNVGDSRGYLLRNNQLDFLTLDQGIGTVDLDKRGEDSALELQMSLANVVRRADLTPQELDAFDNRRGIWSFLGSERENAPHIDVRTFPIQEGDRILLTTDGIHDNLTHREIEEILIEAPTPTIAVRGLVEAAKNRSRDRKHMRAKRDDRTAGAMYL